MIAERCVQAMRQMPVRRSSHASGDGLLDKNDAPTKNRRSRFMDDQ
jgi:hypothetical protein